MYKIILNELEAGLIEASLDSYKAYEEPGSGVFPIDVAQAKRIIINSYANAENRNRICVIIDDDGKHAIERALMHEINSNPDNNYYEKMLLNKFLKAKEGICQRNPKTRRQ